MHTTTTTMYKLVFCLLLCYIGSSLAIQANETRLYFQDYTTSPLLSDDQSVLYIYIADTTDLDNAKKAIFFPHVDKFTRIEILDSFINFSNLVSRNNSADNTTEPDTFDASNVLYRTNSNTTYMWLQFGNKNLNLTTVPKRYVRGEFVLGSFSALIQLTRGVPTGIVWDDGCNECNSSLSDPDQCIDNSCGITLLECFTCSGCTNQTCNIKVYLGWIGTDGVGRPMTSAGNMPSNFSKFALTPTFRNAAGTIKDRLTEMGDETDSNYDPRFDPNVNKPQYTIN